MFYAFLLTVANRVMTRNEGKKVKGTTYNKGFRFRMLRLTVGAENAK